MQLWKWLSRGSVDPTRSTYDDSSETVPSSEAPPIPCAEITPEGCFVQPQDYAWTDAADVELSRRLDQLG